MQRLYLYLASRKKQGIKLITVLNSEAVVLRTHIKDLTTLKLPPIWQREIQKIIADNHMLYEPLMETVPNYNVLRQRLKERGYHSIPMGSPQMINILKFGVPPKANVSSVRGRKTMIQKRK